jgi:hypothetical protein
MRHTFVSKIPVTQVGGSVIFGTSLLCEHPHILVTSDERHDFTALRSQLTRPSAQRSQQNNGILRKVRHNITLHRPITNRSKSNPRRFSGQSGAQDEVTRLQPHRTSLRLSGQQAAQDGLTRLQPRRISTPLRTTGCPGRTHSPAGSPDLHASPDNRLPRMDSLVCSLTGSPLLSGQQAAHDGLTRLQLHRTTAHLRRPTTQAPKRQ